MSGTPVQRLPWQVMGFRSDWNPNAYVCLSYPMPAQLSRLNKLRGGSSPMNMSRRLIWVLSLVLIHGLVLSACGGAAEEVFEDVDEVIEGAAPAEEEDDCEEGGLALGGGKVAGTDCCGAPGNARPGVVWSYCDVTGADLTGADLTGADLTGADLRWAVLPGADLTGANLTDAILQWADLTDVNLTGTVLFDADLTGATCPDGTMATDEGCPVP